MTDFKDEKVRKQNKRAAKRKAQLDNLYAPIRAFADSSAAFSLFCLAFISHPGSPAFLLSCLRSFNYLFFFCAYFRTFTALSSRLLPALVFESPAVLSPLLMLDPASFYLASTAFRTFKQVLLDDLLRRGLTRHAELLCLFLFFGSLRHKINRKWTFDITFISFCLLAGNHIWKEFDLKFAKFDCRAAVKPNRSWQLELLHLKQVCIIEAISLATAMFWDPSFALCHCHIMKLTFKLELKTWAIASVMVKEKIKSIWANRTINKLDQLFWNNPKCWTRTAIIYAQTITRFEKKKKIFNFVLVLVVFFRWYPRYNVVFLRDSIEFTLSLVFLVCLME